MRKPKATAGYQPNPHYTQEDWDEVSDNPEATAAQLAHLQPAQEVLPPALFEALTKRRPGQRGPGRKLPKVAVTLRLDPDVLDAFKASGSGWQTRINDTLRKAVAKSGGTPPRQPSAASRVRGRS